MKSKRILVVAERTQNQIHPVSYELLGKARCLSSEHKFEVHALVLGDQLDVSALCLRGADRVYFMKDPCFEHADEYLYKLNIVEFIRSHDPDIVLLGATNFGRSLAPRLAGALKTGLTADCTELKIDADGQLIQIRPAFSDNILAHIKTVTRPQMATIRYKEFPEAVQDTDRPLCVDVLQPYFTSHSKSEILGTFSSDDFDISSSECIVAVGRGAKNKEDMALIQQLADVLGADVGVTRPLVDMGMSDSARQIGYSGHRVKPKLYIACGISGAPQHIAGMKTSDVIIAINSDPSAPIFKIADIGYVGDMHDIIPRLIHSIEQERGDTHEH